jgi:hypothetical protein
MYFEDPSPPYELRGLPSASGLSFNTATGRLAGIPNNADVCKGDDGRLSVCHHIDLKSGVDAHAYTHTNTPKHSYKILAHNYAHINAQAGVRANTRTLHAYAHATMHTHTLRTRNYANTQTHMHVHMHTYTHTHTQMHMHTHTHMQTQTRTQTARVCKCTYTRTRPRQQRAAYCSWGQLLQRLHDHGKRRLR